MALNLRLHQSSDQIKFLGLGASSHTFHPSSRVFSSVRHRRQKRGHHGQPLGQPLGQPHPQPHPQQQVAHPHIRADRGGRVLLIRRYYGKPSSERVTTCEHACVHISKHWCYGLRGTRAARSTAVRTQLHVRWTHEGLA